MEQKLDFPGIFHHMGVACRRIEDECVSVTAIGYAAEGLPVEDPIQQVRVQFFVGPGPRIELIEPTTAGSPVSGILKRGTKLYHLAYEVDRLEPAVALLAARGFRALGRAAPAAAFGMRRIVFVMSASGLLIELIEIEARA